MRSLILLSILLTSCAAHVPTTTFTFKADSGETVSLEMPKELTAKNLTVEIDSKSGKATIKADSIKTISAEALQAEAERQAAVAEGISKIVSDAAGAAAKGAMKSLVPIP